MDLKLLCYLVHCWHRILMLFHFGRMLRSCNQNCYLNCYCNQKIFHFGRVFQILCSHCLPHCWIGFLFGVDVPQVCLHHCESRPHWSWYQSLSLRIFLFGRVLHSGKLQYFLQYFRLLYCLFHFGRVFRIGNEQCIWWWCCHSFELGNWPNGTVGRVSSDWWLSLGLTTDRSPLRS